MISSVPSPSEPQRPACGTFLATQRCRRSASLVRLPGALMTVVAVVSALTACGLPVGPLRGGEQEVVTMKKSSIVLLRLVATHDGKPMEFLNKWNSMWSWPVRLMTNFVVLVESIDTGDQVREIRAPTPEAEKEGWVYLLLEPGRYYLRVQPWRNDPVSGRFFLSVPVAGTVVYAGSLPITCAGPITIWIMTHERVSPQCSPPVTVEDESESAAQIAKASFAQYDLATILMQGPK
jgi:hypothetical protein